MTSLAKEQLRKVPYRSRTPLTKDRLGRLTLIDENNCWLWQGSKDKNGYARLGGRLVHRIVWRFFNELSPDKEICHSCDNPTCVNPSHLFEGSHHENMLDAQNKRRMGRKTNPKLTPKIYRAILYEIELGTRTLTEIAQYYGISKAYMTKIKRGDVIHAKPR